MRSIARRIRALEFRASRLALAPALLLLFPWYAPAGAAGLACTGHSILGEIEHSRPAAWAEALQEFTATPNSSGVFWRIEKEGVPTSWLFGTMHVPDQRVLALKPAVAQAFSAAGTVVLESVEVLAASPAALLGRVQDVASLPAGQSFDSSFTPAQKDTLRAMTEAVGMPYFAARRLKPWFLAMSLAIPPCIQAAELRGEPALDKKLYEQALASGKTLIGLESADEQLAAMRAFDKTNGNQTLLAMLSIGGMGLENLFLSEIELYLQERPALALFLSRHMPEFRSEDEEYRLVEDSLVHERNRRMRDRILPILARGNVFVAVGALHLIGDDGLIELLRQSGFKITAG